MTTPRKNWHRTPAGVGTWGLTNDQMATFTRLQDFLSTRWQRQGLTAEESATCSLAPAEMMSITGKRRTDSAWTLIRSLADFFATSAGRQANVGQLSVEYRHGFVELNWPNFPLLQEFRTPTLPRTRPENAPYETRRDETKREDPPSHDGPPLEVAGATAPRVSGQGEVLLCDGCPTRERCTAEGACLRTLIPLPGAPPPSADAAPALERECLPGCELDPGHDGDCPRHHWIGENRSGEWVPVGPSQPPPAASQAEAPRSDAGEGAEAAQGSFAGLEAEDPPSHYWCRSCSNAVRCSLEQLCTDPPHLRGDGPQPPAKPARKRRAKAAGETEFPDPFPLGDFQRLKVWAAKQSPPVGPLEVHHALDVVRDWASSNGKRKRDWVATVRGGIREGWALKGLATDDNGADPVGDAVKRSLERAREERHGSNAG